jgi:hypothetical protein
LELPSISPSYGELIYGFMVPMVGMIESLVQRAAQLHPQQARIQKVYFRPLRFFRVVALGAPIHTTQLSRAYLWSKGTYG